MKIRLANINDSDEIAQNNVDLAYEIEQLELNFDDAFIGSRSVFENSNGFYVVADENNKIIGQMYITSEWSDWRNKNIWWIHRIYILREFRNRGIFKEMLKYLKAKAVLEDIFSIRLYVNELNKSAIEIYNKIGLYKTPFIIYQDKIENL
jgi:GNAT superfamily N-acetyltransferase